MAEHQARFRAWLEQELAERQWSARQAALQAGLSANAVSQILAGKTAGLKTCLALAALFRRPAAEVLVLAELVRPGPRQGSDRRTLDELLNTFSRAQVARVLDFARLLEKQR